MKMRSLALAGTIMLATVTGAAAQTQQRSAVSSNDQVAKVHDQDTAKPSRSDWFISPNDARYQENGAPRAGEVPVHNTPYAPIQGHSEGGGGRG